MSERDCTNCGGCDPSRREFLKGAASAVATLTVLVGLEPARAAATQVRFARGSKHEEGLRYQVPAADGVVVDKENEVIIARYKGRAWAFALSCPHQRTMLKWHPDLGRFQCPKHKSKYQPDGAFISGRATRAMDRHAIKLQGRELIVDTTIVFRQDKNAAGWTKAVVVVV